MSEIEKLETENRLLATKVIYDALAGRIDVAAQARLEALSDRLMDLNTPSFCREALAMDRAAA